MNRRGREKPQAGVLGLLACLLLVSAAPVPASAEVGWTEGVALWGADHLPSNGAAGGSVLSEDGRFVAFMSSGPNLVAEDGNICEFPDPPLPSEFEPCWDVYVADRGTGAIYQVSVSSDGELADGNSGPPFMLHAHGYQVRDRWDLESPPAISASGRFVAFGSDATNLVEGDTNRRRDIFVHDLLRHTTQRVSVSSSGQEANNHSMGPSISADGRYVAFTSLADDLVAADENAVSDVYVHDRWTGLTTMASVSSSGAQGNGTSDNPALSPDGRYLAYASMATNLVSPPPTDCGNSSGCRRIYVKDLRTGEMLLVPDEIPGGRLLGSYGAAISSDARRVVFVTTRRIYNSLERSREIYAYDRDSDLLWRVTPPNIYTDSLYSDLGFQHELNALGNWGPSISFDGNRIAFSSDLTLTLEDVQTRCGSLGGGYSCPDVYLYDATTGELHPASVNALGFTYPDWNPDGAISGDGRVVAFWSASRMTPDDVDFMPDVFVHTPGSLPL